MTGKMFRLAAIPAMLLVSACGSSPPVRYFTLDSIDAVHTTDEADVPVLALGPLQLPEYLDRSQMVSRGPGAEIVVDDLNHWAESLGDGLHRVLAHNIDGLSDRLIVIAYPANALSTPDYRLVGRLDRFETDRGGMAVLELQWALLDGDGNAVLPARRDRYTGTVANRNDPGAVAAALSDTLGQFSRDVAAALPAVGKVGRD